VVDDDPDSCEITARMLEVSGYTVLTAADGIAGLAIAEQQHPDAIIMDLMLPVMDGWTASARIKANPALQRTPILVLTAHATRYARQRAREIGCQAFMPKPIEYTALVSMLQQALTA